MKNSILKKIILIIALFIIWNKNYYAQNAMVCNSAQNLCTNPLLTFTANGSNGLVSGLSISNPLSNPQSVNAGCMFSNVPNPQWLIINVTSSGNLGFSFGEFGSAFPQAGNYDWIMWPYTPNTCADIFNNNLPPIACNWNCTGSGGTGMGPVPAGASPCNFQPSIPVIQGQQFIILITNPSGVNTNCSFASTGSADVSCHPLTFPNITACPGELTVVTGTWSGASTGNYTIFPGGISQPNPTFTISSLTTQVFTVMATGMNAPGLAAIADQTTFTLTINPYIPISVSNPTTFCYGSNATFTVNPAGGTYSITGPGVPTTTFSTSNFSISNISTSNIGTFSVSSNYTTGCIGTQTTLVDVTPDYSITVNTNSNVCEGGLVNLTAAMPTATAYSWAGPNGFASNAQNPTLSSLPSAASGIYTVTANINYNGITCTKTNTTQIDVVATNTIAVTPNFTLCQGASLNLISNAVGAVSYFWNGANAYTSPSQNPSVASVLPINAGNYSVTAYFTNSALTCTTIAVSNVSVVATSTVNVIVPANICQGSTATLSANATGALSYTWSGPNMFASTNFSSSIANIQTNASGIYTVDAMFTLGSVSCITTGTNAISVVATDVVTVTPAYTVCQASNLNLVSNSTLANSYSWNGPGGYTSASQNPTVTTIFPTGAGNYTVTAFFTNGVLTCTTDAVSNVSIILTPTINVTLPANICQNATAILNANAVGAVSYSWSGPNSFTGNTAASSIPNVQVNTAGVYTTYATFTSGTLSCISTSTNQMNVVATDTVSVVPTQTVCEAASVNFTCNAVSAVSYSWNGPNAYNTAVQNPTLTNLLLANAGNYVATAFFSNGSLTCSTTAVSNLSIVATPTVGVSVPPNICQNANANIFASALGAISYSWNGPNSYTANSGAAIVNNIQTNGAGVYTATALFAMGTVSCTNTGTNQITVVAINSINITPVMNGCALQDNVLQANSLGAVSYSWVGPNSFTAAVANPTIYNTPPTAAGIYTVTTIYSNGALSCSNSAVLNFIVNPVISFTLPTTQFVCYNSVLTSPGPTGANSYTWQNSSGIVSNAQNLILPNIISAQAGTYSLTATIGFCATTQTISVDVSDPIQFLFTPLSTTICRGDSLKFRITSAGGSGNYAYVWNPSVFLSSSTGSVQTVKPLGTTIYNLFAYDIACPTYTIIHTFTITVKQPPNPHLRLDNTAGCEPFCAIYNSNNGSDVASIVYDFGASNQVQGNNIYYCLNQAGHYKLNVVTTGTNGCTGKFPYSDSIIVYPKPHADFYYNPDIPTIASSLVNFYPTSQQGKVVSELWFFSGTEASNNGGIDSTRSKNPIRNYENVGQYPTVLISTTDKGCADTIFKLVEVIDDMGVYIPNTFTPNGDGKNDIFLVQGVGFSRDDFLMELFASNGNLIFSSKDCTKGWDGTFKGVPAEIGSYIFKVKVFGTHREGYKEYVGYVSLIK